METNSIRRNINRLLLDPNNYRFRDNRKYEYVNNDQTDDPLVQQKTFDFLTGENNELIQDLITSFKTNGYHDVERIQVKSIGDKYLVLEGNRRLASLKVLWEDFKVGKNVGLLNAGDFENIELVEIIVEQDLHQ